MKNRENKKENAVDLTKKFELDANAMNQIVGGTSFWMDSATGTGVTVSGPDDILCGDLEVVQSCEQSCKTCTSSKTYIYICGTKLKSK